MFCYITGILCKANVIIVSKHCDPKIITDMHILHAYTIEEALSKFKK